MVVRGVLSSCEALAANSSSRQSVFDRRSRRRPNASSRSAISAVSFLRSPVPLGSFVSHAGSPPPPGAPVGLGCLIAETLFVNSTSGLVARRPTIPPTTTARSTHTGSDRERDQANTPIARRSYSSGAPRRRVAPGNSLALTSHPSRLKHVSPVGGGPSGLPA